MSYAVAKQRSFSVPIPQLGLPARSKENGPVFPSSYTTQPLTGSKEKDKYLADKGFHGPVTEYIVGHHGGGKVVAGLKDRWGRGVVVKTSGDVDVIHREKTGVDALRRSRWGRIHMPREVLYENPQGVIVTRLIPRAVEYRKAVAEEQLSTDRAKQVHDNFASGQMRHWLMPPTKDLLAKGEYSMQKLEFDDVQRNLQRVLPSVEEKLGVPQGSLLSTTIEYGKGGINGHQIATTNLGDLVDRIGTFYKEHVMPEPIPDTKSKNVVPGYWGYLDLNPKNIQLTENIVRPGFRRRYKFIDAEMSGRIDPAEALAAVMKYESADQLRVGQFDRELEEREEGGNILRIKNLNVIPNKAARAMRDYAWDKINSSDYQRQLRYPGDLAANTAMFYAGKLLHELAYIDSRNDDPGAAVGLILQIAEWVGEYDRLKSKPQVSNTPQVIAA